MKRLRKWFRKLSIRKKEISPTKKLYWDIKAGELRIAANPVTDRDKIVIDQIYEDGFFAQAA